MSSLHEAKRRPQLAFAHAALVPLSLVATAFAYYVLRAPLVVSMFVASPFLVLFVLAPKLASRSRVSFDRDVVGLLHRRDAAGLRMRLRRARWMRWFGAPGEVAERIGLVAWNAGDPRAARAAYKDALDVHGVMRAPLGVLVGYAHASYALGEDAEAERVYERVLRTSADLPRVRRNLAHALLRRGGRDRAARALAVLEELPRRDDETSEISREIEVLRAWALAALERVKDAKRAMPAPCTDDTDALRALREAARAEMRV